MQITLHLSFDGECEAAFLEYQRILGGTITLLLKYGESPMAMQVEPQWHNRIVHAVLDLDGVELAGADVLPADYRKPQGFSVILGIDELEESRRVFTALAEQGTVNLPFQPTFWSAGFGVLVDRFGIPWEINCAEPPMPPDQRA